MKKIILIFAMILTAVYFWLVGKYASEYFYIDGTIGKRKIK